MPASVIANAQSLRFGAKAEDLLTQRGTNKKTLVVYLQEWNESYEDWVPLGVAGMKSAVPEEITFGDVTFEGLDVLPDNIQDWHAAQAGHRLAFRTTEFEDEIYFAVINLV